MRARVAGLSLLKPGGPNAVKSAHAAASDGSMMILFPDYANHKAFVRARPYAANGAARGDQPPPEPRDLPAPHATAGPTAIANASHPARIRGADSIRSHHLNPPSRSPSP